MRIARIQPPVGYGVPTSDLISSVYDAGRTPAYRQNIFETEFANRLGVRKAFGVSSGKAALTIILTALNALTGRRKVIVPAYTCYSLPSSIVKAGLEVVPCDVAPEGFDYNYERLVPMLGSDVLCVVSVHLFGIPSDTTRTKDLCRQSGIFVVEDAAQAMGISRAGKPLGTRGDVGFYSLGRGKNLTCGSGGVIVTASPEIAGAVESIVRGLPENPFGHDARTFLTLLLLSVFVSPSLYWLPAGLPFLRLGETIFHRDFPVRPLSNFQAALVLRGLREHLASLNEARCANAEFYISRIKGARDYGPDIPYLRFPVVLDDPEAKRRILVEQAALGISGMYPGTVGTIRELGSLLPRASYPQAERLASSLITLPTHPLVSDVDRERICETVNLTMRAAEPRLAASPLAARSINPSSRQAC